ncbi:aminopeptidase Q isoform X2 [Drosophila bipectinata]|uniref:aminopeptidase Q isoform X2 n=1 Tax=Drosophila bipectinata TaxID=42026 RepID=UPI0038B3E5F7
MLGLLLIALVHSLASGVADDNVEPIYYNLTILTRMEGGSAQNRYEGFVAIDLAVKNSTKQLTIFSTELNLVVHKTWLLRKYTGRRISVVKATRSKNKPSADELIIVFTHTLWLGETYTLYIYFQGALNKPQKFGYFSVRYNTPVPHFYALTHMEPAYARYVFPCFDLPHLRTKLHLRMHHHKQYVALSNMPVAEKKAHPSIEDFEVTIFEDTPPLPTHMMMWTLHSMENLLNTTTNGTMGVNISIWSRPIVKDRLDFVMAVTPKLLSDSETLFGQPLFSGKSGKFDVVVLPEYSDQRSSMGLLVIGEYDLGPSNASKEILHESLAALVVRQWHGRLVASMGHQDVSHNMSRLLSVRLRVMEQDSLPQSREVAAHLRGPAHRNLRNSKMCLLTHMLCMALGEKIFYGGIKSFVKRYANMTVGPNLLWQEFQQAGRRALRLPLSLELATVMNSWFDQPGFPLITVLRDDINSSVTLKQQRYIQTTGMAIESKSCWWLPIIYITKTHPQAQTEWLGCHTNNPELKTLELRHVIEPDEWILVNAEVAAPIRIFYDLRNWRLLAKALRENFTQVPEVSRAALLDDALHLSWAGYLPYSVTLDLMRYLRNETSHLVWQTAVSSLEKLQSIMYLTTGYRIFKLYMKQLVGPPFKEILKTMSSPPKKNMMSKMMMLKARAEDAKPTHGADSQHTVGEDSKPTHGAGSKPTDGADSKPTHGAGSKPTEGTDSKPTDGTDSKPTEGANSKPTNGADSKPTDGANSKPTNGADSKPTDGADSKPTDGADSKPTDGADSKHTDGAGSVSSLGAMLYRLACQFDIHECMADALIKFSQAMDKASTDVIPEGLRDTVLCIGIRHGVEEFWVVVRDMYKKSQEETEKRVLLHALSCSTEYWALRKLLLWALDRKMVPRSLTVGLLTSVLKGYLGYYVGKQFLMKNMDQIVRRFNSQSIFSILKPFVETVTSNDELAELEGLFREKLSESMLNHIGDLMESAYDKINWRKYQYYELLIAIKNYTTEKLE